MSSIVREQSAVGTFSGTTAPSATFGANPKQNSVIIAIVGVVEEPDDVTIAMSSSGFTASIQSHNATHLKTRVFTKIAGASEGKTFTASLGMSKPCWIVLIEYSNINTGSIIDVTSDSGGTNTNPSSGSITTGGAQRRIVTALFSQFDDGAAPSSPTNSFSAIRTGHSGGAVNTGYAFGVYDKDVSTIGTYSMSATIPSVREYDGIIIAIKERPAVTYVRTGQATSGAANASGTKSKVTTKTGQPTVSEGKVLGLRAATRTKAGLVCAEGVSSGAKPGIFVRLGRAISEAVLSGIEVFFRGASIERVTDKKLFGTAAAKISTTGTGANQGAYTTFVPQETGIHTVSLYLDSFELIRLRIADNTGTTIESSPDIPATNTFMRVKYTTVANLSAGVTYRFYVETVEAIATQFWVDGVQAEEAVDASTFTVGSRPTGGGPVGKMLREQKPAGLVMEYIVVPGSPGTFKTYQDLYDHHDTYQDVLDTEQTYEDVYIHP